MEDKFNYINEHIARKAKEQGLKSIEELTKLLDYLDNNSNYDYNQLKRAIAESVTIIDTKLLKLIYEKFPKLDDLKEL